MILAAFDFNVGSCFILVHYPEQSTGFRKYFYAICGTIPFLILSETQLLGIS